MKKMGAYLGMLGAMLSMGTMSAQAPKDSRDVQGKDEGQENAVPYWYGHQPIFIPSHSQKVKSKQMRAKNQRMKRK